MLQLKELRELRMRYRRSATMEAKWQDPKYRAAALPNLLSARKGTNRPKHTSETRLKISHTQSERWDAIFRQRKVVDMKWLLLLIGVLLIPSAYAANPRYNCTTSCLFVADAYPLGGPVPASCKLYSAGALKASSPAVTLPNNGGVQCQVAATFVAGTYSVTMSAVDGAGVETAPSSPFTFDSAIPVAPLASPSNVRITGQSPF